MATAYADCHFHQRERSSVKVAHAGAAAKSAIAATERKRTAPRLRAGNSRSSEAATTPPMPRAKRTGNWKYTSKGISVRSGSLPTQEVNGAPKIFRAKNTGTINQSNRARAPGTIAKAT